MHGQYSRWFIYISMQPTAAAGSAIGTALGVSVSIAFVVSFSMGVLVASVLCYISRRSKESSHKSNSHATVYEEVDTNKKREAVEMNTNSSYGLHDTSTLCAWGGH